MVSIKKTTLSFALILIIAVFSIGCGSAPAVKESAPVDPAVKKKTTRNEIKKRADSAIKDLDKAVDGVEIKTNSPAQ